MWSVSVEAHESTSTLVRVARPLAGSVALHLALLTIVIVAGSAAFAPPPVPRATWLDLEPAEIAPPPPAPVAASPRPRSAPRPGVEPRTLPVPVTDEPLTPPAQPLPTPAREVTAPEPTPPAQSAPSPPQSSIVMGPSNALEPDRSGASSSATSASPSTDSGPAREPQERGVNGAGGPAVASRPPDASAGGPIVRAARPRGGYQVRPVYPESARRAGIQGTTLLRIYIERDGRVGDVSVQRSAGHQALDEAAADAVRRWRFEPALNSTGPVSMWALVPVEFRIGDRD